VYLDNTNLSFALSSSVPDIGNQRETFFFNQMRVNHAVFNSPISDFQIEDKTFEIGGKKKGQKQISEAKEQRRGWYYQDTPFLPCPNHAHLLWTREAGLSNLHAPSVRSNRADYCDPP
jgi:hypothetical protein